MTSNPSNQTKVRVACQRCRVRRIRCDGEVPSCANCAKAGAACIDVDARNSERLIPRNAVAQAKARIQWLEDIILQNLPAIDLSAGPAVEFDFLNKGRSDLTSHVFDVADDVVAPRSTILPESSLSPPVSRASKRPHNSYIQSYNEEAFSTEARTVVHDLGRLSLNADSREKHYLGSSSGLIFSYLVQTGSPHSETDVTPPKPQHSHRDRSPKQDFRPIYENLVATLPSKDDALQLFEIYLCHVYPDHPILHLESTLGVLEALYFCRGVANYDAVDQSGWPEDMAPFAYNGEFDSTAKAPITLPTAMFHVFMLFTIAASVKAGCVQNEFAPARFYRAATTIAPDVLGETSIASLQAIYLMAIHAFMTPVKLNIWTLTYICMAHAIDLGIHRQLGNAPPAVKITKALLFYSVYSLDRSVATIQGRPLGIRDETFDVKLPTLEELQNELKSQKIPSGYAQVAQGISHYISHRFKLDRIISEIKSIFYVLPLQKTPAIWPIDHKMQKKRLQNELDAWYADVDEIPSPIPLHNPERRRWHLHLEQLYHAANVLLFQPSQIFRNPDVESLQKCFNSAMKQIICYNQIYEQDMLQFDWRTVRSIFACGATIIYCFWKSEAIARSPFGPQITSTLRTCTSLLAVGGIWWPSVKKAKASFERVVDLSLTRINNAQSTEAGHSRKKRASQHPSQRSRVASQLLPVISSDLLHERPSGLQNQDRTYYTSIEHMAQTTQDGNQLPETTSGNVLWQNVDLNYPAGTDVSGQAYADSSSQTNVAGHEIGATGFAHGHVEPEIEEFLSGLYMDESTWSLSVADTSWQFHFDNF